MLSSLQFLSLSLVSIICPLLALGALHDGLKVVRRLRQVLAEHQRKTGTAYKESDRSLSETNDEITREIELFQKQESDTGGDREHLVGSEDSVETPPSIASGTLAPPMSDKEKRIHLIENELRNILKEAVENELGEEFESEAVEALEKAAKIVSYKKKFYDVFKDEIIFFHTVAQGIMDMTLIEVAEEHYFEEDDEFPIEYTAALRSVCVSWLCDDDGDQEYMEKLAVDIDI